MYSQERISYKFGLGPFANPHIISRLDMAINFKNFNQIIVLWQYAMADRRVPSRILYSKLSQSRVLSVSHKNERIWRDCNIPISLVGPGGNAIVMPSIFVVSGI